MVKRKVKDKFKSKLSYDNTSVKQIIYLSIISILYVILGMINFTTLTFDVTRLLDKSFWITYILRIGFALVMMFLAIAMRKEKLKVLPKISDEIQILLTIKQKMIDKDIYNDFGDYLVEVNNENKLNKYRSFLMRKRDKAKKQEDIKHYTELLKATYDKDFDITKYNIKIKKITENIIFSNCSYSVVEGEEVFYIGSENLARTILPTIFKGIFFTGIMSSIILSPRTGNIEQWVNLLSTLWVTISYITRGLNYGDYSINDVYYSALESRKSLCREFFRRKGLSAEIQDNPTYKYKIDIKEIENTEVANG